MAESGNACCGGVRAARVSGVTSAGRRGVQCVAAEVCAPVAAYVAAARARLSVTTGGTHGAADASAAAPPRATPISSSSTQIAVGFISASAVWASLLSLFRAELLHASLVLEG